MSHDLTNKDIERGRDRLRNKFIFMEDSNKHNKCTYSQKEIINMYGYDLRPAKCGLCGSFYKVSLYLHSKDPNMCEKCKEEK